ncbi:hypothetical protein [Sulfurimonas sp.]|uniref:hypothetical protein n=1 Tax=Sulfurimonas sp. TaxID=2022749 RepID=UPI003D0EC2B2
MQAFAKLSKMDDVIKEQYKKTLLKYHKLDTLAMVEVLKKLMKSTVFFNIDNNHSKSYN